MILNIDLEYIEYIIKEKTVSAALALAISLAAFNPARASADAYTDYIERYSELAVEESLHSGIPASITLAQGLLESAAGRSSLAKEGNNHFGIKCHSDWNGATMLRSDDAPDECFRVYKTPAESFADHTRFLQRKRYERLFELPSDDYAAWAKGLRECGYATDPNYAQRLITIIERYGLAAYDGDRDARLAEAADFIRNALSSAHVVRRSRGLHYVIALPGDTYASIAKELGMDAAKLAGYNDAEDGSTVIKDWEEVYLQPKFEEAPESAPKKATIGEGESIHSLAQRFGMTVRALTALNPKAKDRPGTKLKLR